MTVETEISDTEAKYIRTYLQVQRPSGNAYKQQYDVYMRHSRSALIPEETKAVCYEYDYDYSLLNCLS